MIFFIALVATALWESFGFTKKERELADVASRIKASGQAAPADSGFCKESEKGTEGRALKNFTPIKALYATVWTISTPYRVLELLRLIETTELNALVINVKDEEGIYVTKRMADIIAMLKERGVYTIARIVVFQDSEFARKRPEVAIKDLRGSVWKDGGGYRWVDPASKEVWERNADTAIQALAIGFDEVNFDYIRFPSDGAAEEMVYPAYDGVVSKEDTVKSFFEYLTHRIRAACPRAVLSADLFAYTFLRDNDLGIGQKLLIAADYFDVIAPMVYPSHYLPGNFGFENPSAEPYEVVRKTLEEGKERLRQANKEVIIRPWIQDFDLGAFYDAGMVREEIRAVEEAGFKNGWMVWSPSNQYDPDTFLSE